MADAGSNRTLPCDDFMQFQTKLKKLRLIDDRIAHALNKTIPTDSFTGNVDATQTCKRLYEDMTLAYQQREAAIKKCIVAQAEVVQQVRKEKQNDMDNFDVQKKLSNEQTKLRLMRSELSVEEILRQGSLKVFYERCRDSYKPNETL